MKFLKYLLYIIIALVVLFFAMGLLKPKVEYGATITVDKPVAEAWAVGQDDTKYDKWLDGFKSMELTEGNKGEVGSKYKIVVNPGNGQEDFEMIETLKEIRENEYVDMHFDSESMIFNQKMFFSEENGKTTIKTESDVAGKGLVTKSMMAVMGMFGAFEQQEQKNMDNLKKLIEENTTDYFANDSTGTDIIEDRQ